MPYKKPETPAFNDVKRLLHSYEFNGSKLADVLGCCPTTALRKLRLPETLTLADLKRIVSHGHVPADSIREAIKFDKGV